MHRIFSQRRAGVLLHPSSLPDREQEGALGSEALRFIDFLAAAGFSIWQMLPVNSLDDYGSPYQATSVHAGNGRFICLHDLVMRGWLDEKTHSNRRNLPVIRCIAAARQGFMRSATQAEQLRYQDFKAQQGHWLNDYALYSVTKQVHEMRPWWLWPAELSRREPAVLAGFHREHSESLEDYCFEQYVFFSQWDHLHRKAREKNILLFGDMPLFVAHDSVDVWANQGCFLLDTHGQPTVVAGVPPDYFSASGQRWGNPLYNWECMRADGFRWWLERLRTHLKLFDLVRLDHFRGFASYWEIPSHCETAVGGRWVKAPGKELLTTLLAELGELPLIAEDLGTISKDVLQLRDEFELPGMKVLLFAFDSDARNPYLPHNHEPNSVVYTGTHDNNTSLGWFYNLEDSLQQRVLEYFSYPRDAMPWPLIQAALQSVCHTAILPMQDLLGLDGSHRMNTPGTIRDNWQWKFDWEWVSSDLLVHLNHLNRLYGRI
ncbi:MAG: 4-alpha-glucanotransferase [Gammaproteobacteria bacterium RIFCSPLOWO2_02_FULL_56_15]|nr:MAG: 4-alpha-glucanotransferase [Gammaproteobacteria bacterium RIFCSPLOWO2_02_FULL_56_15]